MLRAVPRHGGKLEAKGYRVFVTCSCGAVLGPVMAFS